jgi:hypothetical protein
MALPGGGDEVVPPPPRLLAPAPAPAPAPEPDPTCFAALPAPVALHIFSLLPPDARLCAAAVCRGWREALRERSAWAALDFSRCTWRVTDALLHAACRRARGRLAALDVSRCWDVTHAALLRVVAANAGALATLRLVNDHEREGYDDAGATMDQVVELLRAAPALPELAASVDCVCVAQAVDALRSGASDAFGTAGSAGNLAALRCAALRCGFRFDRGAPSLGARAFADALAAHGGRHAALGALQLDNAHLREGSSLDALVDALTGRSLLSVTRLTLQGCTLPPTAAAALARALARAAGGRGLAELHVTGGGALLGDAAGGSALRRALRAQRGALTCLTLRNVSLWEGKLTAAGAALLGALTGHGSLRALDISCNSCGSGDARRAAGAALAALLAANAPALATLRASTCILRDVGLAPLLHALSANTHLRTLDISNNVPTTAFLRDALPAALAANGSLRRLAACGRGFDEPGSQPWADAAEALVAARAGAATQHGDNDAAC